MVEAEKVHFSVAFMLYVMNMQPTSASLNSEDQGHLVALIGQSSRVHRLSTFSKDFSETFEPISVKFHMQPSGIVCSSCA